MSAFKSEYQEAKQNGVKFIFNTNITKIIETTNDLSIEVIKTELVKDKDNKDILVNIKNSNYSLKCDYLIKAIGTEPQLNILNGFDLQLNEKGLIDINGYGETSNRKIFSGGDLAGVKSTVAWAARSGRNAAIKILEYLKKP